MRTWQAVTKTIQAPAQRLVGSSDGTAGAPGPDANLRSLDPPLMTILREVSMHAASGWKWLERKRTQQLASRRIRVSETVALGEKRFVSIVQIDGVQFLIGGASGSVTLLAKLDQREQKDAAEWRDCETSR